MLLKLPTYICQNIFNLMKLTNMNIEKVYKKYEFTNNYDSKKTDKKVLYKILVDIEKNNS